ncbi:hypothetical protein HAX54_039308, partial [Datura stramonium]|nr:hypothetical protein [Datura stramonium]
NPERVDQPIFREMPYMSSHLRCIEDKDVAMPEERDVAMPENANVESVEDDKEIIRL